MHRSFTMAHTAIDVNAITGIWAFLGTINWTERWLHALLGFHVLCFVMTVLTRKHNSIQAVIFIIYLGFVYFSETINELGSQHWRSFSSEQYFDSNGLFISIVFSTPLLLNCFIILLSWLYDNYKLLVKVGQAKKRHQIRQARNSTADSDAQKDKSQSSDDAAAATPSPTVSSDIPPEPQTPSTKKEQ